MADFIFLLLVRVLESALRARVVVVAVAASCQVLDLLILGGIRQRG